MRWYLSDLTNPFDLGSNCKELTLGGSKRSYKVIDYIGSNGGTLRGFGNYSSKTFQVSINLRATSGQASYHNATRTLINQWFSRMIYDPVYLYIVTSDASPVTKRTKVYCTDFGAEKIKYERGLIEKNFTLVSPSGYFENVTATTGTQALANSSVYTVSVTNAGDIDCPVKLKYTPTGNETYFIVEIADTFGFKLGATYFNAGEQIIYNTANNALTINGVAINVSNYLISGSIFNLSPGVNTLYVQASGAGAFAYEYNTRYI
jgi:hypothetical protein